MAIKVTLFIFAIIALIAFVALAIWKFYQATTVKVDYDVDYTLPIEERTKIKNEAKARESAARGSKKKLGILFSVLAVGMLAFTIFVPGNIHQVDATQVAVVKEFGTINGTRGAGMHWDFYMTKDYIYYPTTIQEISLDSQAYSSDTQYIGLTVEMQYKIDETRVDEIEKTYRGLENLESKIKVVAIDKVKAVYAKYKATEIMEHRDAISAEIKDLVETALEAQYPISVETIAVPNIDFSDTFEKSVEDALAAKVAAEQAAQQAKAEADKAKTQADAELYKKQQEAKAKIAEAEAEAQAITLKAEAEASAVEIAAKADALATNMKSGAVAEMLGFETTKTVNADGSITYTVDYGDTSLPETQARIKLLAAYLEYMKYLEIWDGKLPVTMVGDSAATVVIPTP